jgi:hypothetical protein
MFARIPVRRDIAFIAAKNHHYLRTVTVVLPQRIGARDMRAQQAEWSDRWVEIKREVVGVHTARRWGDQNTQWMRTYDAVQGIGICDGEMGGCVHELIDWLGRYSVYFM